MTRAVYKQFMALLQQAGFEHVTAASKAAHVSRRMLDQASSGKLPPNHPYLRVTAQRLGVSEAALRAFATGPRLSHKEEARLIARLTNEQLDNGEKPGRPAKKNGKNGNHSTTTTRMTANGGNGTNGTEPRKRGQGQRDAALRRDAERAADNPLVAARVGLDMTVIEMAKAVGTSPNTIRVMEAGGLAPNSPLVERAAEVYRLPLHTLQQLQKAPPMSESNIAGTRSRMATMAAKGMTTRGPAMHAATTNGDHRPARRPLRKLPMEQRELLRTLTNTVNINCMKGIKETTVSTQMLVEFLREYYAAIGVDGAVILDFVFDRLFD